MSYISGISGYTNLGSASTGRAKENESSLDFASLITGALESGVQQQAVSMTTSGALDGYSGLVDSGMESMLLGAAANGEIEQEQLALFMLLMVMQQSEEMQGSAQMQGIMAMLLSQMQE